MTSKRAIRKIVEKFTGTHIYRTPPRGVDLFHDIKTYLPRLDITTIFDVGANAGQSAESYLRHFPAAEICCFEPVDATYRLLESRLQPFDNVRSFKLALGAERGSGHMVLEGSAEMFFLRKPEEDVTVSDFTPMEEVAVETLDGFCETHGIGHINYLKIDTEGADLDVLAGAQTMLDGQHVDVIELEAGMNSRNERHVPFDALLKHLEAKNYFLFGIYEQMHEWQAMAPNLRRTNPVFISDSVISTNQGIAA